MGFFKKKDKNATPEAEMSVTPETELSGETAEASDGPADEGTDKKGKKAKKKRRGREDKMSDVFHENVVETIIDSGFSRNEDFIHDGKYVGLFFDTTRVGGFGKRTAKDEDKGAIIELVNSGRIMALCTADLMAENAMVIVPDSQTLDNMLESGVIGNVDYPLCYVSQSGDVDVLRARLTPEQALQMLRDGKNVGEVIGDEVVVKKDGGEAEPEEETLAEAADESADLGTEDDEVPVSADEGDGLPAEEPASMADEDMPFDTGNWNDDTTPSDEPSGNWSGGDYGQSDQAFEDESFEEEDDTEEELIGDDEFERTVKRVLYSDELGLEISSDPFDSQYLHGNSFIPFSEDRGNGFLNNYLAQMSKDANTDLRRLHQDNILLLRTTYMNLMNAYCQDIVAELGYEDCDTIYAKLFAALTETKNEKDNQKDRTVAEKKQELESRWNDRLQEVGESAKASAIQQYRERYGKPHEDELRRAEQDVKDGILNEYNDNVRDLHDKRRAEAAKRLDMGINAALAECGRLYSDMLAEENKRYKEYRQQMVDFITQNREDEIARANVLERELQQSERVDAMTAEYTAKVQQMTKDFEARRALLQSELEQSRREAEKKLAEKDTEYKDRMHALEADNATLNTRIDTLLGEMARLDEKKEAEYKVRMDALAGEREAAYLQYDHLAELTKNTKIMFACLCGVGVIAAAVIGFIAGEYVKIKGDSAEQKQRIVQEMEQEMGDIQMNLPGGYTGSISDDGQVTIVNEGFTEDAADSDMGYSEGSDMDSEAGFAEGSDVMEGEGSFEEVPGTGTSGDVVIE